MFFFFKQKTAYEMRISDWSSDVCSSDLFNQYAFTGNLENSAAADPKDRFVAFSKDSATKGETLSGYGQATWKILSNVELTGGVRYIYETKDSYFFQPYINPALRFRFRQGDRIDRDQSFSN